MERTRALNPFKSPAFLALAAGALLLTSACGPQVIKGRPPFISISGMSLEEDRLSADFDVRNHNEVDMTISRIEITLTVNDVAVTRENNAFGLLVGANSSEQVHVQQLPDDFTRDLLNSLESGEVKSLPFTLAGRVNTAEDGILSFDHQGHLYPVPGRPGHFRSATTHSKGLKREDDF
jgi:LEA14-like dessication related protein